MATKWIKTTFLGVRYREHSSRQHRMRPDRNYSIRYKIDGKDREEAVGWASESMTPEKAFKTLTIIRENIRRGKGPCSYKEIRLENKRQEEEEKKSTQQHQKRQITFSAFWESEYLPAAEATKKPTTMESERWLYSKWIAPSLGDIPLPQIDVPKVEALMLRAQSKGKSAATIRYILAIISQVWAKASNYDLVQGDCPTRKIKKPRKDNRRMRFLTHDEATRLLQELSSRSTSLHDSAVLSLFCGLRAGEIHSLIWDDINFEDGKILVRDPKNKINRHAFMTQEVKDVLQRLYTGQAKTKLIFPATNGKKRRWVSDTFARVVGELGLNDSGEFTIGKDGKRTPILIEDARQRVVFHSLRHTFASWLVQKGTPLYTVAELMGHSDLVMTQRYSHLAPDTLRQASLGLQGCLGPLSKE